MRVEGRAATAELRPYFSPGRSHTLEIDWSKRTHRATINVRAEQEMNMATTIPIGLTLGLRVEVGMGPLLYSPPLLFNTYIDNGVESAFPSKP